MTEKCKPIYKNVNSVKSFSDQRAATVQVMNRICENEEYLYQKSNKLNYLSPPAVRKRFNPVLVDPDKSYGYQIIPLEDGSKVISFDKTLSKEIHIDFSDMSRIDEINSTVRFATYVDSNQQFQHRAELPRNSASSLNSYCKNFDDGDGINSYWYAGFDKNIPYQIRPDWIVDNFDSEIPSVVRAQSIVIPEDVVNDTETASFLESVSLYIQSQGDNGSNWGSPLYVQLWNTEAQEYQVTEYKNNQNVPIPGQTETVYVPVGNPYEPLASAVFNPDETTPGFYNFVFDKAVEVNSGEHYAIVIFSPLSHWAHAPRIGGWGRNCNVAKDNGGDAFLSENNGRSWVRYGHNDNNLTWNEYKLGKLTPQDFAFQAHIRVYTDGYDNQNTHYLYLKPIKSNPIKSIYFSSQCRGNGSGDPQELSLAFEVSVDGRNWTEISGNSVTFNPDENGNYPITIFIRAVLSSSSVSDSPSIDNINIIVNSERPKKMYVRTPFYSPKLTPMLGANIWGRIYAPFEAIPSNAEDVDCKVEIIQENVSKEHFYIITVNELDKFTELMDDDGNPIIDVFAMGTTANARAQYLIDNPSVIVKLKKYNVYIKPYTLNEHEYLLSFEDYDEEGEIILGGLKLTNNPAYPLVSVIIQPYGTEKIESYGEHYDFTMDYETDTLTLVRSILDNMPVGALSVAYNKVFIQDLTLNDVGDRVDSETGLIEQGIILDYFKEEIFISDEILESRRVPLRMVPIDPIREVKIIRDDDELEVFEDIDFVVDYASKQLIFRITGVNGKDSILNLNDTISVVYTPNLEDTGIAIGYTAKREDLNHQLRIKPNFIEYK